MNIILASQSRARQNMLHATQLDFEIRPAALDERSIINSQIKEGASPKELSIKLAIEKAINVSTLFKNSLVIGSDQILECGGEILFKANDRNEAVQKLKTLSGKTHTLTSAVAVAKNGEVLWDHCASVELKMKYLDEAFIDDYCEKAGDIITNCVGAYEYETSKTDLFENYPDEEDQNNYFTILGMPFLPLVKYLQNEHGAIIK